LAEEPELHLMPHLRNAQVAGPRLADWSTREDGVLDTVAEYRPVGSRRDLRRQAWALIGAAAGPGASVRERADGGMITFEVVTGHWRGPKAITALTGTRSP
jgi:hypothetical protein